MAKEPDLGQVAGALRVSVGLLVRRLRQAQVGGRADAAETSALARLDRGGPTTAAALAKLRADQPAVDGRDARRARGAQVSSSAAPTPTTAGAPWSRSRAPGLEVLRSRRNARTEMLAQALATGFSPAELEQLMAAAPLIERLAQSI